MKATIVISIIICLNLNLFSQGHYLVELEPMTPDLEAMVQGYEGQKAMLFMANDVNGNEVALSDFPNQGKNVILWFWNTECPKCFEQIDALNMLQQKYGDKLQIVGLADEDKDTVGSFVNERPFDFPILPNCKILADGPYGGDLGYPRIFIVDKDGTTQWVFPQDHMKQGFDTYKILETLHVSLTK